MQQDGFEYSALGDVHSPRSYLRAALGAAGLLLTAAAGFTGRHFLQSGDAQQHSRGSFVPAEGMDAVLVKPGAPVGLVAVPPPTGDHRCIFTYGTAILQLTDPKFTTGAKIEDAWLYGATSPKGEAAQRTGHFVDVIKGRLLCWPSSNFPDKLQQADKYRRFSNDPNAVLQRSVAQVVKEDGSSEQAVWYHSRDPAPRNTESKIPATQFFQDLAKQGKDSELAQRHAPAVKLMLEMALPKVLAGLKQGDKFSAVDLGCGSGWVCGELLKEPRCEYALGLDGASNMINHAKKLNPAGHYEVAQLPGYKPQRRFALVHSMAFLYYLDDPLTLLKDIHDNWMTTGGVLVAGLDYYKEHAPSEHSPATREVAMTRMSTDEWRAALELAGFMDVQLRQVDAKAGDTGTLVLMAVKEETRVQASKDIVASMEWDTDVPVANGLMKPQLSEAEKQALAAGKSVQRQSKIGNKGEGWIVWDVPGTQEQVWKYLADLPHYDQFIPTVRAVKVDDIQTHPNGEVVTKASFTVSRFRLKAKTIHTYRPLDHVLEFKLDDSSTTLFFKDAAGYFHTEEPHDRPKGVTRVYLAARLTVGSLVPGWLIDYAAERALRRATNWIVPVLVGKPRESFENLF